MTNATMNNEQTMPILLTARDFAAICKCHTETIYRWRREGIIDGIDVNGCVRFRATEVSKVVSVGCGQPRAPRKQPATSAVAVADDSEETP